MLSSRNEQQDIQDRAYDLFGELILEKEANELLAEIDAEGDGPAESEAFIARVDARCLSIIEKHSRKARVRRFLMQTAPRIGQIAAIMIAVIALAGCTALASSETARVYLMRLLVQTTDEYTRLSLVPSESEYVDVPDEWKGSYYPTYIPEGLILTATTLRSVEFSQGDSLFPVFIFGEYDEGSVIQIDTEGATVRMTKIHGQIASISTKGTTITIYWSEGMRYFVLTFRNMNEQVAMAIAESVTQIK